MKIFKYILVSIVFVSLIASTGCQKKDEMETKAEAEKPSRVIDISEVTSVMTVKEINLEERMFTLSYDDMNEMVVEAADDLTGIENIKVGDKVSVTYLTSTAVYVTSPDQERPPVTESRTVEVDSKDGKPRKVTVEVVEKTSIVEAVDLENRTATLKGPDGKVETVQVSDELKNLENVKVGDQVVMQYTKSLAVDISKVED